MLMNAPGSFDGYHLKIDIHLGKDDGLLSFAGLCCTLNRYDNLIHGLPNLHCEDASLQKGPFSPNRGDLSGGS